ncbi:DMT family transporter [Bacteriovorax sp. BSW11_IV]|uniref:DMT family transporter n=1 Tax=Bacteriovorax sp. BSW11_IV TaxID=1353529 RepID=UPI002101A056|nr:DMT family transporter [Bacteriovorax sp. BSW11_IV]
MLANFSFALGSQAFTYYSRLYSSTWMNAMKALVGLIFFVIAVQFFVGFQFVPTKYFFTFFLSGALGLGIGDIFLFLAYREMGPGRTMMLFGFQPVILGILGYLFLDQALDMKKAVAIIFFICCLFTLSFEAFKKEGHWQLKGIFMALLWLLLDSTGVVITRYSFNMNPELHALEGNIYRCLGALFVFFVMSFVKPFGLVKNFVALSRKSQFMVVIGSFFGTFLSLALYLEAIKTINLASLAGINVSGTVFSGIMESIIFKKRPTWYLGLAFVFFLCGMAILFY